MQDDRSTSNRAHAAVYYDTGDSGTGRPHLASQSSVVLSDDGRWLIVVNPGSDDLSVFSVDAAGLELVGSGRTLVVTEQATNSITTYAVDEDGFADGPTVHASSSKTPYGFDFTRTGAVVVTEAAGAQIGAASASSYALSAPARLAPVSGPVGNTRSEVCWAPISKDDRFAYVTNLKVFGWEVGEDGSLSPVGAFEGAPATAAGLAAS